MITDTDIDRATLTLAAAGLRAPDAWADPQVRELGLALWRAALEGLDGRQLDEAVLRHLSHPERGRWWPTPADLLGAGGVTAAPKLADADETAWQSIARKSFYDRTPIADCDAVHMAALAAIGGRWEIQHAEGDWAIATLRKRFLEACASRRAPTVKLIEGGKAGELPAKVLAFVGGEESPDRAAARARRIGEAGR
jgi:hypothetical protein